MANSMLAYILQDLGMPSIGKDRFTPPSHPVVAAMDATSRMVRAAVVRAVGTGTWP